MPLCPCRFPEILTHERRPLKSIVAADGSEGVHRGVGADAAARFGYNRPVPAPVPPSIPDSFNEMARRVTNWGRWGPDDRIGTLNLIDAAARLRGVASVVDGEAFPLGIPMSEAEGIQMGFIEGRVNPTHSMVSVDAPQTDDPGWVAFSEDVVTFAMQCATHWDGLAHTSYGAGPDGRVLYNGYPASTVTEDGWSDAAFGISTAALTPSK